MRNVVKNNWFWFALAVVVFLVNQLVNIVDIYPVEYDEAWYGSTAYNFAHGKGFLNSIVGSRGNANFIFPMIAGTFMHIFGYNLLAIRLANVFCGVLALFFINLCFCQMKVSWQACALALLFFVSIDLYNSAYRWGRPEGCAMMFLAGGVWMYLRYKESHSWMDMIGLSLFAYLAACAHPFALLPFALMGLYLLIETIYTKEWRRVAHLFVLFGAAILAIVSITWVSYVYNGANENYVQTRFSAKGASMTIPIYFQSIFLSKKRALYLSFLICMLVFLIWCKNIHKDLAIIALVHLLIFPIPFADNAVMAQYGVDYFVLIATVLLAISWDTIGYDRRKVIFFVLFCLANLCVTYAYNYGKHYDNVNTILQRDFQQLIPQGSKVFGPIRQWPMIMDTDYESDHKYFRSIKQQDYDFIILNAQDDSLHFPVYKQILPIDMEKMSLMYERETKQYGLIQVYRNRQKE